MQIRRGLLLLACAAAASAAPAEPVTAAEVTPAGKLRGNVNSTAIAADTKWYTVYDGPGTDTTLLEDMGNNKVEMTIRPDREITKLIGTKYYLSGKLEVRAKAAANTSGVITSIYLTSGGGRTSDQDPGKQDELDFEWRGIDPTNVQTNVFVHGEQQPRINGVGGDASATEHLYGVAWKDKKVDFFLNGELVRTTWLPRPLKPMRIEASVWTTRYGWPGLITWAGPFDWKDRNNQPATATFQIVTFPDEIAVDA